MATTNSAYVDFAKAPLSKKPKPLGAKYIIPFDVKGEHGSQRYYTECWILANGEHVVFVADNGGTSLMNGSERIAAAIDSVWGANAPVTIIEVWDPPYSDTDKYKRSGRHGGNYQINRVGYEAAGLFLKP